MIKFRIVFLPVIFLLMSFAVRDLNEVRDNYNKFANEKELCKRMIAELKNESNVSATHLAYLGGLQAIWANHVFSPISKLSTFKEGKKNIEQAIKQEPVNVELRFIRLSIQKNIPSFLGYKSNITEDIEFIKENRYQISSNILQHNIRMLLKD